MLPDFEPGEQGIETWTNIHNVDEFLEFARKVNSCEKNYENEGVCLCFDLDMSGVEGFKGVAEIGVENSVFKGVFDGRNRKIKNLTVKETADIGGVYRGTGLFGSVSSTNTADPTKVNDLQATIKNVILENYTVDAIYKTGGIIGHSGNASVINCHITNGKIIEDGQCVGAFVGSVGSAGLDDREGQPTMIKDCTFQGEISSTFIQQNGGVLGAHLQVYPNQIVMIENCTVSGTMTVTDKWGYIEQGYRPTVGGIVGVTQSHLLKIKNCHSAMKITVAGNDWREYPIIDALQPVDASTYAKYVESKDWIDDGNSWDEDCGPAEHPEYQNVMSKPNGTAWEVSPDIMIHNKIKK